MNNEWQNNGARGDWWRQDRQGNTVQLSLQWQNEPTPVMEQLAASAGVGDRLMTTGDWDLQKPGYCIAMMVNGLPAKLMQIRLQIGEDERIAGPDDLSEVLRTTRPQELLQSMLLLERKIRRPG